jgi:hypothetical protein
MADYGIFGHGSSGNSWFANKLDDFHDSTKKYDPIGHYSVENPMKSAHWLVEKSSKGLGDLGIAPGFNERLSGEADENGNNFGLGSQRMGLGIASVLGAMYGGSYLGGGEAGGTGATGMGDGAFLGEGTTSGIPAWDGGGGSFLSNFGADNGLGYQDADGFVGNWEYGGKSPMWNPSTYSDILGGMGSMGNKQGSGGGQAGGGGQGRSGGYQPPNMGNPALTAALSKLVDQQEQTRRQQNAGPLSGAMGGMQQQPTIFGLTPEDIQALKAQYQTQYGDSNAGPY